MTRLVSSHLHFHVEATIWGRYAFGSVSRAPKYHQRLQREKIRACDNTTGALKDMTLLSTNPPPWPTAPNA